MRWNGFEARIGRRPRRSAVWRAALAAAACAVGLVACDMRKIADLEVGVTTEQDIRAAWGEPAVVYADADGGRTLEYPRQPAGRVNYMLSIGADGRLIASRQVLQPDNFAKVATGWTKPQVRRLLGQPARMQSWPLKRTETWDWRYADGHEGRVYTVTFDADGRVIATASTLDEVEAGQRG